ncbi:MAG: NAD(P)H-binding protein [Steroidobacteraceae bacterium]
MNPARPTTSRHRSDRSRFAALAALLLLGVAGTSLAVAQEGAPKPPPALPSLKGETIVVAGATGRTGRLVVQLLREQGAKVRGFSRKVDEARAATPDVEWISADVRDAKSLQGIARGADRMVIAIGSNSFRDPSNKPEEVDDAGVARLAAEARAAGLKSVVLISSAGVTHPPAGEERFAKLMAGVMNAKLRGENALRASGVPYTVLRPVGLWDKPGGQFGVALVAGDPTIGAMISRADVAAVAVHALADPAARNKTAMILNIAHPQVDAWKSGFAALPGP